MRPLDFTTPRDVSGMVFAIQYAIRGQPSLVTLDDLRVLVRCGKTDDEIRTILPAGMDEPALTFALQRVRREAAAPTDQ